MTIVNTITRFDVGYVAKRSKKRTDVSATDLVAVVVPDGNTPVTAMSARGPDDREMIWARGPSGLLHRHDPAEENFTRIHGNPLFVDIGTHRKTVVLDEAFLFGVREILEDGRIPAAAEAQRIASRATVTPAGLFAPTPGAYVRVNFTIDPRRKMAPAVTFVALDGGAAGTDLSGCYPLPLLHRIRDLALDLGWSVPERPLDVTASVSDAEIEAMLNPAIEHLCEELVGRSMPNRNASNYSMGHLDGFLRYTDPAAPPTASDLREIVAMIEADSDRGDYTNPTGEKVLLSTLRNRLMNAVLQDRSARPLPAPC